jgi:hypothetical protein
VFGLLKVLAALCVLPLFSAISIDIARSIRGGVFVFGVAFSIVELILLGFNVVVVCSGATGLCHMLDVVVSLSGCCGMCRWSR